MPEQKKSFKYYAIRVVNMVIFRRTVAQISLVKSRLYKPNSTFIVEQVAYTGGKVIGSIPYSEWCAHGGRAFARHLRITREQFRALSPFMQKGE